MATYNIGTGLVIARKEDGSWSAPSAISYFGVGWGAQVGVELTDYIIVLRTKEAVSLSQHSVEMCISQLEQVSVPRLALLGGQLKLIYAQVMVVMQLVTHTAALKAHLLVAHLKEAWLPHAHQRTPDSMVFHLSMHQISCLFHCPGHLQQPLSTMLCQSYYRSLKNDPSIRYWVQMSFLRTEGKGTFKPLDCFALLVATSHCLHNCRLHYFVPIKVMAFVHSRNFHENLFYVHIYCI